jgi:hypothetical protein
MHLPKKLLGFEPSITGFSLLPPFKWIRNPTPYWRILPAADEHTEHFKGALENMWSDGKKRRLGAAEDLPSRLSFGCTSGCQIRDAILVSYVLLFEGHLKPNCHFTLLKVPWSKEQSEKQWLVILGMFYKLQYIETQLCITNATTTSGCKIPLTWIIVRHIIFMTSPCSALLRWRDKYHLGGTSLRDL